MIQRPDPCSKMYHPSRLLLRSPGDHFPEVFSHRLPYMLRLIQEVHRHDPLETGLHVHRVAGFSEILYREWARRHALPTGRVKRECTTLRIAAMLHDVGKTRIPAAILCKPGPFVGDEYDTMKAHTHLGARLFGDTNSRLDRAVTDVALTHHERWDGSGYPGHVDMATGKPLPGTALPDGSPRPRKGNEIPLFGRIVALADVYDALHFTRVYKSAWTEEEVLATIRKERDGRFDPELVDIFLSRQDCFRRLRHLLSPPVSGESA